MGLNLKHLNYTVFYPCHFWAPRCICCRDRTFWRACDLRRNSELMRTHRSGNYARRLVASAACVCQPAQRSGDNDVANGDHLRACIYIAPDYEVAIVNNPLSGADCLRQVERVVLEAGVCFRFVPARQHEIGI